MSFVPCFEHVLLDVTCTMTTFLCPLRHVKYLCVSILQMGEYLYLSTTSLVYIKNGFC